jgi:hypothetical protein
VWQNVVNYPVFRGEFRWVPEQKKVERVLQLQPVQIQRDRSCCIPRRFLLRTHKQVLALQPGVKLLGEQIHSLRM